MSITESTIALIDSLKSTTGAFGLAGTGSEYAVPIARKIFDSYLK